MEMKRRALIVLAACALSGRAAWGDGAGSVPERADVPERYRWDLEAIYPTAEAWEEAFAALGPKVAALGDHAGHLGEGPASLLAFLKDDEAVTYELERLYVYANMKGHEDMRLSGPQDMASRAQGLLTRYGEAVAFFSPELLSLPEEDLLRWTREDTGLGLYAHLFERELRARPHVLPRAEEELLARAGDVLSVPDDAFGLLTNAGLEFPTIEDETGEPVELTEERWYRFSRSPDRSVRRAAFCGIHETYGQFKDAIGALYAGSVKGDVFLARSRRYEDSLDSALFGDAVPRAVYDRVIETARRHAPLMHRLVELKRRALGLDELHYYDLNAPLSEEPEGDISYERAVEMVAEALAPLGEGYVAAFRRATEERWIDVHENQGKRKGAYSWGSYGTRPYVLLNWNGTLRDVFTLAHEMGHALHSWYSHAAQPQVYADYPILLAEVASTTNEALLLGHLLSKATDEATHRWLLSHWLDMVRTTAFRQAMFAEFELRTHERVEAGGALTPDWMGGLWRELNEACYGPMIIDDALCVEWARIPHFYSAFYVWKYVTGFVAANAFADRILSGEDGAVDRYLAFLESGSSAWPLEILKRAGVDLESADPFERTMRLFEERLGEAEALWK